MPAASDSIAAEAELEALVARLAPGLVTEFAAARGALRRRLPTAHEIVYEYRDAVVVTFSPTPKGYDGALSLRAGEGGLQLYFNRSQGIPDPERLLQGSGKLARWVALEDADTLRRPAIAQLMEEAVASSPTPFPESGGSVVVRATTARRRGKDAPRQKPPTTKR